MVYSPNKYRETEGIKVRRLGIDLSEARLKAIAFELGIKKAYSAMTQAEKAQLRYHAIMTQTTKAQGDMARTLEAPSNQLRILQAAASQAARAIGNMFIPVLNAVLPSAIAVVNAVRMIASAFASLLGFAMPTVDYSGIDSAANAAGKLNENLGGAGGSAKELQKVLMGFDEINKIPDASGGGGGGGGGGALDGFDFELLEYDFLGDAVNSRVQQIMQKFAPALDFIKNNAADILQIAKAAGVAFLEWKVASSLVPELKSAKGIAQKISALLLGLGLGYITVKFGFKFTEDFMAKSDDTSVDWGSLIASGLTSVFGSSLTGLVISKATGYAGLGWMATGVTLTISTITDIALQQGKVAATGTWDKSNTLLLIKDALQGVIGGGAIGFALGGVPGAAIGAVSGIIITLTSTVLAVIDGFRIYKTHNADMQMRIGVHMAEEDIKKFIKTRFKYDLAVEINKLDAAFQDVEQARANINDVVTDFSATINLIQIGAEVDKSVVIPQLVEQLTGDDGIIKKVEKLLESEQEHLKLAISLVPPVSSDGNTNYSADLYNAINLSSQQLSSDVEFLGTSLADLLTESMTRELTANEQKVVETLSMSMLRIEQALVGEQAAIDFYTKVGKIDWTDLDAESFKAALNQYNSYVDEYRNQVTENLQNMVVGWQARLQAHYQTLGAYQELMVLATEQGDTASIELYSQKIAAVQDTINTLRTEIDNFDLEGSVNAKIASAAESTLPNLEEAFLDQGGFRIGRQLFEDYLNGVEYALDGNYEEILSLAAQTYRNTGEQMLIDAFDIDTYQVLTKQFMVDPALARQAILDGVESSVPPENYYDVLLEKIMGGTTSGGGGGGSPIIAQAQEAGKQVADAFVGAIDDGMKKVEVLGDESTFSGLRTQLAATGDDARGISEAIHEIPTNYAINLSIPSYSTIISRINNIATRVKSITSGSINIKVKAGVDSGSKQFLMQLAQVSPTSTLAGQLMELIELSAFAKGGFPKRGDLFIANESGPELVGRIGNKTAVANEDQIGDTILSYMEQADGSGGGGSMDEERFASALVRAMKNAGLGALRIDGKDIIRSINRETQRTGHTPITIK